MSDSRPTCYRFRAPFGGVWNPGCSAWFAPGGNAYIRENMVDRGGKVLEWSACEGCKRKAEAMVECTKSGEKLHSFADRETGV